MSNNANEVVIVSYLKTILETAIASALASIGETEYLALTQVEKTQVDSFSKAQVILGDDEFDLLDASNVSTPVILPEIDARKSTKSSVLGSRIYGTSHFTFSVMVARENRTFLIYMQEVIDIVNKIEDTFKAETEKKILVGDMSFANFNWNEIKSSGAVIPITTSVNNYDYSVT